MKVTCIVAAAGRGKRLEVREHKPFVKLEGEPMLARTLKAIEDSAVIDEIIAVVSRDKLKTCERLVEKYGIRKVSRVIPGGKRRFDSVKRGLAKAQSADFILIHDGARPFIGKDIIKNVFDAAKKYGAAICALPSKQTLKLINNNLFVVRTPRRKSLWEAQTPQGFKKDLIVEAYKASPDRNATDDASLVEKLGHKVKIVTGSYRNIKITTPEDLALAKILCK